jgi:K+ transporter
MPTNVARFEILMYLALAMTVLITIFDFNRFAPIVGAGLIVGTISGVVVLTTLLVWAAARRRQTWARWFLLALFIVGMPGYAMAFLEFAEGSILTAAMSVVRILCAAAALYFVFTGDARDWFRRPPHPDVPAQT